MSFLSVWNQIHEHDEILTKSTGHFFIKRQAMNQKLNNLTVKKYVMGKEWEEHTAFLFS